MWLHHYWKNKNWVISCYSRSLVLSRILLKHLASNCLFFFFLRFQEPGQLKPKWCSPKRSVPFHPTISSRSKIFSLLGCRTPCEITEPQVQKAIKKSEAGYSLCPSTLLELAKTELAEFGKPLKHVINGAFFWDQAVDLICDEQNLAKSCRAPTPQGNVSWKVFSKITKSHNPS